MEDNLSAEEIRHFYVHVIRTAERVQTAFLPAMLSRKEVVRLTNELDDVSDLLIQIFGGSFDPTMLRMITTAMCLTEMGEHSE